MANIIKQLIDSDGNNIYPIAYAQGGVKISPALWTNPDPSSSYGENTVSLDLSKYTFVLIEYRELASNTTRIGTVIIRVDGGQAEMISVLSGYVSKRNATVSTTGVAFTVGDRITSFGSATTDNNRSIPVAIYGIEISWIVPTTVQGLQYIEV